MDGRQPAIPSGDHSLILGLKAKDSTVFQQVYERYWSRLYVSAYNVLRDRQQAEDVVQEVFSHLWNQAEALQINNLSAWLFSAVRYQVFNIIRSGKVRDKYQQSNFEELEINNIAEAKLDNEDLRQRLHTSIEELPERCREIFLLSRFEYLSHKEIAKKLNISEKTVENQITIALKKLRISLQDMLFILPLFFYR